MDGTLYDSMPNHARAWYEMVREQGIEARPEEFFLYEGATGAFTVNLLYQRAYGRDASAEEVQRLYERKAEIFRSLPEPEVMPGARELLEFISSLPWQPTTVLVTGSAQGSLLGRLDRDFPGCFPAGRRVTALDVSRGKPEPEPFLRGAELAGCAPQECVAVDNAPLGVISAHRADCFTVAVRTGPIPAEELAKAGADTVYADGVAEFLTDIRRRLCNG
ncbi:MAG: HAD-IA family hydrolase [Muribaculaceae bacterium]|nr:HAD-IA family hydrolase [Muribaculaceae bacterium]